MRNHLHRSGKKLYSFVLIKIEGRLNSLRRQKVQKGWIESRYGSDDFNVLTEGCSCQSREYSTSALDAAPLFECSEGHLKDILIAGYWTGMRKSEILKLTWSKVDLKNRMIRLEAEDTEEGKGKGVPISDEVYKVLTRDNRHIRSADSENHVFLYHGKRPIKHFTTALRTTCESAGIIWGRKAKDGFIFHDLRHTFVTDMRKAGVDKSVRMSITGHAIQDLDDRYNKVDDEDKHQAIMKLETFRADVRQTVRQAADEIKEAL